MTRSPVRALLWVLLAVAAPPRLAYGQPVDGCRLREESDRASFSGAWQRAIASLEHELHASSPTTCHGTELILMRTGDSVRVTARAPDGRRTGRLVEAPAGLSAIAFGLLVAAPGEAPPAEPDPLEVPPPAEPPPQPPPPPPPQWELAIGASAGARVAFRTDILVSDFDIRADLLLHDWLVTLDLRAAPAVIAMRGTYDSDAYNETAVGLGLGRRVQVGHSMFALSGAANASYVWLENDTLNVSEERAQLRLAAIARWGYGISRGVRLDATLDGELAPAALFDAAPAPGMAAFPTFTVGFRVGAEMLL